MLATIRIPVPLICRTAQEVVLDETNVERVGSRRPDNETAGS